jgi:hypothetical protein
MRSGGWLTEVRVEQLGRLLAGLRRFPSNRVRTDRLAVALFPVVGGSIGDIPHLVEVAALAGLTRVSSGHVVLTKDGRQIATQDGSSGGRLIAKALINTGLLAEQARALIETGATDSEGSLICRRKDAIERAPQLTALLRRWPEVALDTHLRVPGGLVVQITSLWALLAPEELDPSDGSKLAVGDRAELYSYKLEIESAAKGADIDWVAKKDSNLGYDLEDFGRKPSRMIEVKGSRGLAVRFLMSPHEFRVAHRHPDRYEVHYWGEINLDRKRDEEYRVLRAKGYPLRFWNLRGEIGRGSLELRPETWEFTTDERPLSTPS